jgi:hypothetical protein
MEIMVNKRLVYVLDEKYLLPEQKYGFRKNRYTTSKGVKLTLGGFAICKTENARCEAGFQKLTEMRELNTSIVATRILMNERHPIRHFFTTPWEKAPHHRFS